VCQQCSAIAVKDLITKGTKKKTLVFLRALLG
jgi:hypothetical protein